MIWIGSAVAVWLLVMLAAAWFSLHPIRTPALISPGAIGAPQEDVEFRSACGTLRGWWVEAPDAPLVAVMAHGYMMNRSELAPIAWQLWRAGYSSLLFDFPAHGLSDGRMCSLGYREADDVVAAVAFARRRRPDAKIVILGSSMGAAAAALACGRHAGLADGLILDSAYSRLASAVVGWWRFVGGRPLAALLAPTALVAAPLVGFNPFRVDVSHALAKAGPIPVLVLHGRRDTLALPAEADRNFAAATGPKEFVWFEGRSHCEARWLDPEKYATAVLRFLRCIVG